MTCMADLHYCPLSNTAYLLTVQKYKSICACTSGAYVEVVQSRHGHILLADRLFLVITSTPGPVSSMHVALGLPAVEGISLQQQPISALHKWDKFY